MNQDPNKKKKVPPIKAFYQQNPNFMIPKPVLKDLRKNFGFSQNKVLKIAQNMMVKPENRIYQSGKKFGTPNNTK